jgi:hypothetical protein
MGVIGKVFRCHRFALVGLLQGLLWGQARFGEQFSDSYLTQLNAEPCRALPQREFCLFNSGLQPVWLDFRR